MPAPRLIPENVRYLVVHCSATSPKVKVDRAVIDRWHRERGWLGIGYHFVIGRDAVVEVGRELDVVGAHVEGYNSRSVGICLAGGVNEAGKAEDNFTAEQKQGLAKLLYSLLVQFPKAEICGHRDLSPDLNHDGVITPNEWLKECPSFDVKAWWHATMADPKVDA